MVKKIAMAFLSMAVANSLYAEGVSQSKRILGLEVGYTEIQADIVGHSDYEGDSTDFGFRIGAQDNEWRTMFVFDYYDSKGDDQNVEKGFLTVDYFFISHLIDDSTALNPYIGLNAGYANYESTLVEDEGFIYGAQAGVTVSANEMIELDLGYRYSLSEIGALDNMGSVMLGIHFNY